MSKSINVLIACDTFKGTLSSLGVCTAISKGLQRQSSRYRTVCCPVSDGGAGLLDALCSAMPTLERISLCNMIVGPLGSLLPSADYAESDEHIVVEMAQAAGLPLVPMSQRNPLHTTSWGVGQLILAAMERDEGLTSSSRRRVFIGIGGSSTNDAGLGALQAMGLEVVLHGGAVLQRPLTGGDLRSIEALRVTDTFRRVRQWLQGRVTLICDVSNPFIGPQGATYIYGPQKGATNEEILLTLEEGMRHVASIIERDFGNECSEANCQSGFGSLPGGGGAGGMSGTFAVLLGATCWRSGADVVAELLSLREQIRQADVVITGEGSFDAQTRRYQKTVARTIAAVEDVCAVDGKRRKVVIVCGRVGGTDLSEPLADEDTPLLPPVVTAVLSLSSIFSPDRAMEETRQCLEEVFQHRDDLLQG